MKPEIDTLKLFSFKKQQDGEWKQIVKCDILTRASIIVDHINGEYYLFVWCEADNETGGGQVCIHRSPWSVENYNKLLRQLMTL